MLITIPNYLKVYMSIVLSFNFNYLDSHSVIEHFLLRRVKVEMRRVYTLFTSGIVFSFFLLCVFLFLLSLLLFCAYLFTSMTVAWRTAPYWRYFSLSGRVCCFVLSTSLEKNFVMVTKNSHGKRAGLRLRL